MGAGPHRFAVGHLATVAFRAPCEATAIGACKQLNLRRIPVDVEFNSGPWLCRPGWPNMGQKRVPQEIERAGKVREMITSQLIRMVVPMVLAAFGLSHAAKASDYYDGNVFVTSAAQAPNGGFWIQVNDTVNGAGPLYREEPRCLRA